MRIRALIQKQVFCNGDFYILSVVPLKYPEGFQKSKYGTVTLKGCLGYLNVGNEYDLEVELDKVDKYGVSYTVTSCPTLENMLVDDLTPKDSYNIMCEITTPKQAKTLIDTYPDFVSLVLNDKIAEIDTDKLYNIGKKRLDAYIRDLNKKFRYYHLINKLRNYDLTTEDCRKLLKQFPCEKECVSQMQKNPYYCLIDICGRSFLNTDKLLMKLDKENRFSFDRIEYCLLYLLNRNEIDSCTKINANSLVQFVKEIDPELVPKLKQVAIDSYKIYYDDETKDIARMDTYQAECNIAYKIKYLNDNPYNYNIDYKKYQNSESISLTDEQIEFARIVSEKSIGMLNGGAGCVDKDTEFFNGEKWKKISEYEEGEFVLQCDSHGESSLVIPERYIKEPCDKMYHFETKYGLSQTLSPDHIVSYYSERGHYHTITAEELYQKQMFGNGFKGKILTSFNYSGKGIDLSDTEIKIMCAVICDGTFYNNSNINRESYNICRFHIKKDRKKIALRNLFNEANIKWEEVPSACEGCVDFYIKAPRREKSFGKYWYNCTQHQLQVICDNILQWGLNSKKTKQFFTKDLDTTNFIQFAFSACGYSAYISELYELNDLSSQTYIVSIYDKTLYGIDTEIKVVKPLDGLKYCFTVPKKHLVLRKDNKIFVTHNCGKTSSVVATVKMLEENNISYRLLAPTGIAAKVLSNSTNRSASTIHKYIAEMENMSASSPDIVFIDEFSMVGVSLLSRLFNLLDKTTKVFFICDLAQLPSISAGNVLHDITINNSIPIVNLTKIFRYGKGALTTVATDIRNGKRYLDNGGDILFSCENMNDYEFNPILDNPMEQLAKKYKELIDKGYTYKDIMVLSAFNVGDCGTYNINNEIQDIVNPLGTDEKEISYKRNGVEIRFRIKDKVINIKNNYQAITQERFEWEKKVQEMITHDNENDEEIELEDMPPYVTIVNGDIGYIRNIDNDGNIFIQFDENIIVFEKSEYNRLLLAYSISCHKSQGSESKVVVTFIHPSHKKMLNRQLLYVADTRSKEKLIEIADPQTINECLDIVETDNRETFLSKLLKSE